MLTSQAQLRARLKLLTDSASEPVLADPADIDILLQMAKRVDLFGNPPDNYTEWAAGVLRAPGDQIVPVGKYGDPSDPIVRNGFYYTCTVGGVSSAAEPAWPVVVGALVADGAATWSCTGVAPWNPRYDLYYAVAQGWLLKSSRLVGHYNFMTGGKMLSRQQFYDHCMDQYKLYSRKSGIKGIRLGGHETLGVMTGGHVPTNAD